MFVQFAMHRAMYTLVLTHKQPVRCLNGGFAHDNYALRATIECLSTEIRIVILKPVYYYDCIEGKS